MQPGAGRGSDPSGQLSISTSDSADEQPERATAYAPSVAGKLVAEGNELVVSVTTVPARFSTWRLKAPREASVGPTWTTTWSPPQLYVPSDGERPPAPPPPDSEPPQPTAATASSTLPDNHAGVMPFKCPGRGRAGR